MLNHDLEFIRSLTDCFWDLSDWQICVLESYGVDLELLYPDEYLDWGYLYSFSHIRDPNYISFCENSSFRSVKGIKSKKLNEYKRKVEYNLMVV